jgi:hypothetical protein
MKTTALYDTGAESFCLSSRFCSRFMVPQVKRDQPQRMTTYSGHTGPGGEAYSEPIWFELFDGLFKQPCEILPLDVGYDMIIPYWWKEQVGLKFNALLDGSGWEGYFAKLSRNSAVGANLHVTDESGGNAMFPIEWDESILVGPQDPIRIGTLFQASGVPKMLPNGTWVPTKSSEQISMSAVSVEELHSRLPSCYHQFQKLFEPRTAAELPKHSPYDHAIDLLPGTAPP